MNLTRLWWALGALLVAAAALICLIPSADIPSEFEVSDKVSHLTGHAALALYFAGLVPRRGWWKIFVFLLVFGITIEFAQYYMHAGREGDPRDVIANASGAALGLLLARCGLARWPALAAWLLGRRTAE
jgi:glycopeptide antibiotics resistance protein